MRTLFKDWKSPTIFIETNVNPCSIKFLFEGNYFWNTGWVEEKADNWQSRRGPGAIGSPPPPQQHTSRDRLSLWRTHKLTSAQCEEMYKYCGVFSYLLQYSTDSAVHFYTEQTNSIAACASINTSSLLWKHKFRHLLSCTNLIPV